MPDEEKDGEDVRSPTNLSNESIKVDRESDGGELISTELSGESDDALLEALVGRFRDYPESESDDGLYPNDISDAGLELSDK
jgi:hypothetical protein